MVTPATSANRGITAFAPMSAQRVLIFGGISLIAAGMLFGDVFAVFVLHQNGGQTAEGLLAASRAVAAGNSLAVEDKFPHMGELLEEYGTQFDRDTQLT